MADGFYAIGEIRLRMGDLDGAEEALRSAHGLGKSPQPTLARIRLAQGKIKQAETVDHSALAETTWDRASRTRLLPAAVEIFVASGAIASARESAEELGGLVETFASPAMQASRQEAWGRVHLAEGDLGEAPTASEMPLRPGEGSAPLTRSRGAGCCCRWRFEPPTTRMVRISN